MIVTAADARTTSLTGRVPCVCAVQHQAPILVAVTGGPGAGKTAALEAAARMLCQHVSFCPEAASILFSGGFPRSTDPATRRAGQRAIYHIQRELEWLAQESASAALILCDRGTVDGLAYWPGTPAELFEGVGSSQDEEISRYGAVIHMRTPSLDGGYEQQGGSRIEDAKEAADIDRQIADAWRDHPRRFMIESNSDFLHKITETLRLIETLVPPCCSQLGRSA